jgi:hypothetical protein
VSEAVPAEISADAPRPEAELREAVDAATPRLLAIPEGESVRSRAPGKWSPKEILGHLVDSASHNHQRFVRVRFQDDLVFVGYEQDPWVASQNYRDAPWRDLVALWRLYNLHIARVMEAVPDSLRREPRARHNLHEIAWQTVPPDRPTTLEYLMRDYVGHLRHHLAQILGPAPGPPA